MRKLTLMLAATAAIVAGPSMAADLRMPVKAPAVVVAEAFNWTGFYIGGHVGWGWGNRTWRVDDFGFGAFDHGHGADGFLGGGQIGYNWQFNNVVFGIEGDASWLGAEGSGACSALGALECRTKMKWLSSLTGRLGFVAWSSSLLYVKGGWAWAGQQFEIANSNLLGGNYVTGDITRSGPTIGGGVEWGFSRNWSAKLEYMYVHLGDRTQAFDLNGGSFVTEARIKQELHTFKFGVNYRFNSSYAPVVASY